MRRTINRLILRIAGNVEPIREHTSGKDFR